MNVELLRIKIGLPEVNRPFALFVHAYTGNHSHEIQHQTPTKLFQSGIFLVPVTAGKLFCWLENGDSRKNKVVGTIAHLVIGHFSVNESQAVSKQY